MWQFFRITRHSLTGICTRMADNTLPPGGLSGVEPTDSTGRRTFLRRAIGIGVPVVLATVPGRTVLAQVDAGPFSGGCASMHASGWRNRPENEALLPECDQPEGELQSPGGLSKPGGSLFDEESSQLSKPAGSSNQQVNPGQ